MRKTSLLVILRKTIAAAKLGKHKRQTNGGGGAENANDTTHSN